MSAGNLSLDNSLAAVCIGEPTPELRRIVNNARVGLGLRKLEFVDEQRRPPGDVRALLRLNLRPAKSAVTGAYTLAIKADGIHLTAGTTAGLFYGVQTLRQLLLPDERALPFVDIEDAPDFPVRGVLVDISRNKVPKLESLKAMADWLASLKLNQLQLYMEHTFAFPSHPQVWADSGALTAAEVGELDAYCRERYIELVPATNCFGHMERWLMHSRYRGLAEATGPWRDPWGGTREDPGTLNPTDPRSIQLVESILGDLLPAFSSKAVNVGCDETFELGQGRSAEACNRRGVGRVYLDFVQKIYQIVKRHKRQMLFWADMVQQHPESLKDVPGEAVALEWGYEADHPFGDRCAALAKAGLSFYVCPGTSSWRSISGRLDNARTNLLKAAEAGLKHRAAGYLIADWGDLGHRQYISASYLPIAYGAGLSWCLAANRNLDASMAVSTTLFEDRSGLLGRLWGEAGMLYREVGLERPNETAIFRIMQADVEDAIEPSQASADPLAGVSLTALDRLIQKATTIRKSIRKVQFFNSEARIAARELTLTLDVLIHSAERGRAILLNRQSDDQLKMWRDLQVSIKKILQRHRVLWLARNRADGLLDSRSHYERNLTEYQSVGKRTGAFEKHRMREKPLNLLEPMEIGKSGEKPSRRVR